MNGFFAARPSMIVATCMTGLLILIALSLQPLRADDEVNTDTVQLFVDLLYHNRPVLTGGQWVTTEKGGIKTIKTRDFHNAERPVEYLIDRKNWYARETFVEGTFVHTNEAGIYFRKDNTPLIAVSYKWGDDYKECGASIHLYEITAGSKATGSKDALREVTGEIFPALSADFFLSDSQAAIALRKELGKDPSAAFIVEYKIPQVGTAITAVPATTAIRLGCHHSCDRMVDTLSKYKSAAITWNKVKGRFEVGGKETGRFKLYEN